jgi:acylpyruvate hydrolase
MRLVSFRLDDEGPARAGLSRDAAPEAPLLDLGRQGRLLGPGLLPPRASVKDILGLPGARLVKASRAAARLWARLAREPKLAKRVLLDPSRARFLPPVPDPQKIICIGQNYIDHCREQNAPIPKSPIIFAKFPPALIGHKETVRLPRISEKVDYEAELAFVIGRPGRFIEKSRAYEHVAGYTCLNDVSARDLQFGDGQWVRGKSCETFAPCGPALVTRDEVPQPGALRIGLELNGQSMQDSSTSNLIFDVPYLVSFLSEVFTLETGDIVSTGTPPGVGCFRKPPVFLKEGDTMAVTIEGIGRLESAVRADPRPPPG